MLHNEVIEAIDFEVNEIEKLFSTYGLLFEHNKNSVLDDIETVAMAGVLHSFYNGIEKILVIIAKHVDKDIPTGIRWHSNIIIQMSKKYGKREAAFSEKIIERLREYLAFRHFYRHAYSFHIDKDKLKKLSDNVLETWNSFKYEIIEFENKYKTLEE